MKRKPSQAAMARLDNNLRQRTFFSTQAGTGDSVLDSQRRAKKMTVSQKGRSDKKKPKYDT